MRVHCLLGYTHEKRQILSSTQSYLRVHRTPPDLPSEPPRRTHVFTPQCTWHLVGGRGNRTPLLHNLCVCALFALFSFYGTYKVPLGTKRSTQATRSPATRPSTSLRHRFPGQFFQDTSNLCQVGGSNDASIWNDAEQAPCELPLLSVFSRTCVYPMCFEGFANWTLFHAAERGQCELPLLSISICFPEYLLWCRPPHALL